MNYAQVLSETFLFKSLPPAELKKLAEAAQEERLAQGEELFREGEKGDDMYIIALGTVRVIKKNKDGVEEEVANLGTGSYFGEMAMVADDHERTATIVAQEPCTLLVLRRAAIDKVCAADDKLAHHFYLAVARGLVRRLRATTTDAAFYKALAKKRHS